MIKREELLRIASLKGLPPRLAELDYLQDIALLGIYREFGNKLIFKGGTGLYKLYQLNRFSEDLDFTAEKKFKPKDFFARLPALFSLFNINCSVKVEQFPQSINVYVEINGPLYDGRKESRSRLIMNISLREKVFSPLTRLPYISLYQEVRPFDIYAMEEKEILAEKVRAVHQREKARDVYDLWYLLTVKKIPVDFKLVQKKLSSIGLKFSQDIFLKKIKEKKNSWQMDLSSLISGQLLPFPQAEEEIKKHLVDFDSSS
ncbi:TPA: nucleotidyl transferase AbiEii/AbiGii toxin family protein [Candidatus Woesearchaeota archaeon]|nr:nucleotidyl transferase AbiEii/AbiGii toxin family protein [Candidatus Woesearchaeota archaeon]HIH12895.1 nucleotidyl transferase AbiEii/AbiGii toxin family protein [Candidatus Woesearchaeota archaeon]